MDPDPNSMYLVGSTTLVNTVILFIQYGSCDTYYYLFLYLKLYWLACSLRKKSWDDDRSCLSACPYTGPCSHLNKYKKNYWIRHKKLPVIYSLHTQR